MLRYGLLTTRALHEGGILFFIHCVDMASSVPFLLSQAHSLQYCIVKLSGIAPIVATCVSSSQTIQQYMAEHKLKAVEAVRHGEFTCGLSPM